MNIILLSKTRKSPINLAISRRMVVGTLAVLFVAMPLLFASVGYSIAYFFSTPGEADMSLVMQNELAAQRKQVADAMQTARDNVNALSLRVGDLQAQTIRLNALGKRLVEEANLDHGEFNFDEPPAVGGPASEEPMEPVEMNDFLRSLEQLSEQLENQEQQMSLLESVLDTRELQRELLPAGRPIIKGWISSHFGKRTDPFTGRPAMHHGLDFAGKEGSEIISVAGGVVTYSGDRYGYGKMVEVDHGNGYVTRYAHNKKNLVNVGDVVKKEQVLALMGNSGRSTGPHVHFEVLRHGRAVDPQRYVRAAR
jgi:murein DD-endopeptidase MepM/ murein hydrolase activator NlpD